MRWLVKLLVVLVICVAAIGFYRGWFRLSSSRPGDHGEKVNVDVHMSMDKGKMKSDVQKAEGQVKKAGGEVKQEIKDLEGRVKAKEAKE
jgi:hypothetical protein